MKFTVLLPVQTVAMAVKETGKHRRVNFLISLLFFSEFLTTIYSDSVLMAADYTGHEDDFKNTHPLSGCIRRISSRYSLTLILHYQCYNQDHAIGTMQTVY
jgi:hypothetical protein